MNIHLVDRLIIVVFVAFLAISVVYVAGSYLVAHETQQKAVAVVTSKPAVEAVQRQGSAVTDPHLVCASSGGKSDKICAEIAALYGASRGTTDEMGLRSFSSSRDILNELLSKSSPVAIALLSRGEILWRKSQGDDVVKSNVVIMYEVFQDCVYPLMGYSYGGASGLVPPQCKYTVLAYNAEKSAAIADFQALIVKLQADPSLLTR